MRTSIIPWGPGGSIHPFANGDQGVERTASAGMSLMDGGTERHPPVFRSCSPNTMPFCCPTICLAHPIYCPERRILDRSGSELAIPVIFIGNFRDNDPPESGMSESHISSEGGRDDQIHHALPTSQANNGRLSGLPRTIGPDPYDLRWRLLRYESHV
jgi:hypothetical protein